MPDIVKIVIFDTDTGQTTSISPGGDLVVTLDGEVVTTSFSDAANPIRKDIEGKGDITVGITEVELEFTGTPTAGIRVQADDTNTGIIYIGKVGLANDGSDDFIRLKSGDEVVIPYNDADNAIFLRSDTAAQKVNAGAML